MKKFQLSIYLFLFILSSAQAGSLYRWVDKDGNIHYGDRPAEDAVKSEQKTFSGPAAASDDDLSYGVRKAKQDFPVTLYVASNCGDVCVQARSMLNKRGIPFAEKNLVTTEDIEEFKTNKRGSSVPSLTVGETLLSGFEEGQWNSELDIAGYPKIAPYGSRPVKPAAAEKPVAPAEPAQ